MSNLTHMVAAAMCKQAFSFTDPGKCEARNYYPSKPNRPRIVNTSDGTNNYNIESKQEAQFVNSGKNRDYTDGLHYYEKFWLDPHDPISGTGFGRPYWEVPNNPFTT